MNLNQLSKLSIYSIIKTYKFDVGPPKKPPHEAT
jgi:hypothetical protein